MTKKSGNGIIFYDDIVFLASPLGEVACVSKTERVCFITLKYIILDTSFTTPVLLLLEGKANEKNGVKYEIFRKKVEIWLRQKTVRSHP